MDKRTGATIMLVLISAIVLVTLVLWRVERVKHWRAVRSALRNPNSFHDAEEDESDIDPYGLGMNDKDIV